MSSDPQMGPAPRSRIFVAVDPRAEPRIKGVLRGHELTTAGNCEEARDFLQRDEFDLVVLGVNFDESQMFSLLGDIRSHARYRKVPILCVLEARGRYLSGPSREALDHAVKAAMANGFLDLENFSDDDRGNSRIRRIVDYLILINGDLQQQP